MLDCTTRVPDQQQVGMADNSNYYPGYIYSHPAAPFNPSNYTVKSQPIKDYHHQQTPSPTNQYPPSPDSLYPQTTPGINTASPTYPPINAGQYYSIRNYQQGIFNQTVDAVNAAKKRSYPQQQPQLSREGSVHQSPGSGSSSSSPSPLAESNPSPTAPLYWPAAATQHYVKSAEYNMFQQMPHYQHGKLCN